MGASPPPPPKARRLDERLVVDGLAETRSRAEALIRSGAVLVDERPVEKPGTRIGAGAQVRLRRAPSPYVSRGGEKLAGALADLGLDVRGLRCIDLGASTGGFTDCLLQAGAERVLAVDVGYGQFHSRLRGDPRVELRERTHVRDLALDAATRAADLIVADLSFISLVPVLPLLRALAPRAGLCLLVKPQFEVGRGRVGKGGVVRDDALREEAAEQVRIAAESLGYRALGRAESRLAGPKGNREIFLAFAACPAAERD